jgi:hypothetical protein
MRFASSARSPTVARVLELVAFGLACAACSGTNADGLFGATGGVGGGTGCDAPPCGECASTDCEDASPDGESADDAGLTDDRSQPVTDGGARDGPADAGADSSVEAAADGCVASREVCDGLDNDCNGVADDGRVCPTGCMGESRRGVGYMFCFGDTVLRTWPAAEADCEARGMHLVRVNDMGENAFINNTAVANGFLEQLWLGGHLVGNDWQWTDGTVFWRGGPTGQPVGNLFSNWRQGEPQNFPGSDNCADKRFGDTEVWEDLACDTAFGYVCEH